ncbi:MAG TPA: hypothetical protein VIL09_13190 [Microvirga sp.]|jgi:flagellar motility protein MotE (MotC chaperone)
MMQRLRLIDAVAVAAAALLGLKLLGLATGSSRASDVGRVSGSEIAATDQTRAFADALAKARTNYTVPEVTKTGSTPKGDGKPAVPPPAAAAEPTDPTLSSPSPSERAILERLGERRDEWQQKGKDLELREKLLENAERKLDARINDLKALEDKTDTEATKRGDTEVGALKNLVTMYETMKPKEAARVFDRLPHDVLVPVVLQMNPRKMAEVLAVMSPEAAERLTVALANRARGKSAEAGSARPGLPANELPAIEPVARP